MRRLSRCKRLGRRSLRLSNLTSLISISINRCSNNNLLKTTSNSTNSRISISSISNSIKTKPDILVEDKEDRTITTEVEIIKEIIIKETIGALPVILNINPKHKLQFNNSNQWRKQRRMMLPLHIEWSIR